ncbi:hypothetical protein, partial [Escherichia albertii]|uniref:hypothetical protein n=1 Tax=Escherichia albertii TaxID=208962 RepID=UPI00196A6E78
VEYILKENKNCNMWWTHTLCCNDTVSRLFLNGLDARTAPVMLSGEYLQRAGVFSFQQPMPLGIKPPQHCASPEDSGLALILRTLSCPDIYLFPTLRDAFQPIYIFAVFAPH